jgi:signal transduction histidine kinase
MSSTIPQPNAHVPSAPSGHELALETGGGGHHHQVQFYEGDEFLVATVADFVAAGLTIGQPVILIATGEHRAAFARRLRDEGWDIDAISGAGQLTMLDARETMQRFMDGRVPDSARFRSEIGVPLEQRIRGSERGSARLFGEMVDLLWTDGNTDGALRLEELWNELATTHAFSLLCAYSMAGFYRSTDADRFREICRLHTHVVPTERYFERDGAERLREITLLEQRARSLEAEIARRRELEQRLRERERELRDLLIERQRLLEAERAAREEAEHANRAKSDFLAMMSHELRTPLNAIGGHIQLITMGIHGPVSDAQRDALERVQRSQRHLLALINDVLNLSRIEAGAVEYEMGCVALAPLIEETVSMLEPLLTGCGLVCEFVRPPGDEGAICARADQEKTHQIVLNLLTNAIKFTPEGGRIGVEVLRWEGALGSDGTVAVRVRDTGIGIAAAQLDRIFEPFVQLGRRPSRQHDGAGLGLAISRDLARGMGGDLTVESTPGEGTTFTLLLPAAAG